MLESEMTTREALDHTLRAYANLERRSAEKGRRINELEAGIDLAQDLLQQVDVDGARGVLAAARLSKKGKSAE